MAEPFKYEVMSYDAWIEKQLWLDRLPGARAHREVRAQAEAEFGPDFSRDWHHGVTGCCGPNGVERRALATVLVDRLIRLAGTSHDPHDRAGITAANLELGRVRRQLLDLAGPRL